MRTWRGGLVAGASVALLGLTAAMALAEVAEEDGVRVTVTGKMSPTKLPRTGSTPIAVNLASRIVPTKKGLLPKLTKITIAINSYAEVDLKGIPVCRQNQIDPSTDAGAMESCGRSLVGEGDFSAEVRIPDQSPFPSDGKVLAFNGKLRGKPVLFAHVYGTKPAPTSYVLPFVIKESAGTYGTILEGSMPNVAGDWGYVTALSLNLKRGYLSAACSAPEGFPSAVFPLARTAFSFKGGLNLTSTLTRSCKVR